MSKKKIVVTGGAGFLGSRTVKLLLAREYEVTILDDFSNGKRSHLSDLNEFSGLKIVEGDITSKEIVDKVMRDCQIVIHFAVLGLRQSIKEPIRVNDVIINGTLNCLSSALTNNVELFLNCSSSEVFGTANYVPMDEAHPLNPETPYAAAKVAQDKYVFSYGRTFNLPWVTMRPFNMYGPNSHWQGFRGELIPKMIVRAMNKKPLVIFGDGNQTRDFIFVDDVAEAVVTLLENPKARKMEINFCSSHETTIKRVAELICENFSLDKSKFIKYEQQRPGDVKRHLGDNTKFKQILGQSPKVSIESGIESTVKWFKSLPFTPEELLKGENLKNWE